ncbi:DJ-1/PfpI family protein [Horticoccus luteus]|uniref:DJ-1/PfpI family protein n=1 Tax=Horticoccus luteus TaxID=2862869 RepID=UPI002103DEDD|nr:DJ-1/PfpI family protein [Horticoccus luteus]
MNRKTVAILVFDDVEVLDLAGPFEVFAVTDELCDYGAFNVCTVAPRADVVRARNGLRVVPDYALENCPPAEILVVPGGFGTRALLNDEAVIAWVRTRATGAEIVMSVCTGALVLARAGLLDGLRVTTHHEVLDTLRALAPAATVDANRRYHDNGRVLTAAGISAGIDGALHLVRRELGEAVAERTARYMEYTPEDGRARQAFIP